MLNKKKEEKKEVETNEAKEYLIYSKVLREYWADLKYALEVNFNPALLLITMRLLAAFNIGKRHWSYNTTHKKIEETVKIQGLTSHFVHVVFKFNKQCIYIGLEKVSIIIIIKTRRTK